MLQPIGHTGPTGILKFVSVLGRSLVDRVI